MSKPAPLLLLALASAVSASACRSVGEGTKAEPARSSTRAEAPPEPAVHVGTNPGGVGAGTPLRPAEGHELAAFAGGCFWGTEDTFRHVPGVTATAVGYTGGRTKNPSYEDVCSHTTGHAEAVLVEFDPAKVTYAELVRVFFESHDPTTMNRQGPDVGDQYRSEVFTFGDAQADIVREAKAKAEREIGKPVVTRISPIGAFWKAEEYHQQYDEKTGRKSCPLPRTRKAT